ncbi:hypothetical protein [Gracilibacillus lacisalsi]|uniref:hypothetical protein n=1 Tax=Gracilibacillus lacisalsi TaxID=393087 RepID=UPI00037977EB|nr:hypothetical protein [Gracilibacillus lacisalsi]
MSDQWNSYYGNPYRNNNYHYTPYFLPYAQPNQQKNYGYPPHVNAPAISTDELMDQLNKIYEKLNQLEEENKQIKEELANKKSITVENVNNKIQDLNVQELSGSLLVGLSALSDAEELQELLSEQEPVFFNDMNTEQFENNMMQQQNAEGEEGAQNQPNSSESND